MLVVAIAWADAITIAQKDGRVRALKAGADATEAMLAAWKPAQMPQHAALATPRYLHNAIPSPRHSAAEGNDGEKLDPARGEWS